MVRKNNVSFIKPKTEPFMIKSTTINRQGVEWILEQPMDVQLSIVANHLDICKAVINSLLQTAVQQQAGPRYCRIRPAEGNYSRWGFNPGSVRIGNQKLSVAVPRIVDKTTGQVDNVGLYDALKDLPEQKEEMVFSVLKGLSTRDYSQVASQLLDSFGLSASSISRHFIEHSSKAVEAFSARPLEEEQYVALFIDGKHLAGEQMIIVLGITAEGVKQPLDVIQSSTENSRCIKDMLSGLISRGLQYEQGLLVVTDGSKGIHKAVEATFGHYAVLQRCQWHKRENVVSYLKESEQAAMRKALQRAYSHSQYATAKAALEQIADELKTRNVHAANSLLEGLEQTLTIQRLGLHEHLSSSFTTTNCIESLNSQVDKYVHKVKHWMHSDQRNRWVIMALSEAEKHLHKVNGHKHLHLLKQALQQQIQNTIAQNHSFHGGTSMERISTNYAT
jgi:putative transposase